MPPTTLNAQALQANQQQPQQPLSQPQQFPQNIEIGTIQAILGIVVFIFVAGAAWGTLKNSLSAINKLLTENIAPDLKDVRERFMVVEDRVDTLWKDKYAPSHSPRQLNERGTKVLNESGIKEVVEKKKGKLLQIIKGKDISNPYDAEKAVLETVAELPTHCPEVMNGLKDGAFKVGADLDAVFLVGGIHLRNLIFPELDFKIDDLDKPRK
jgi:hypothetical protein